MVINKARRGAVLQSGTSSSPPAEPHEDKEGLANPLHCCYYRSEELSVERSRRAPGSL